MVFDGVSSSRDPCRRGCGGLCSVLGDGTRPPLGKGRCPRRKPAAARALRPRSAESSSRPGGRAACQSFEEMAGLPPPHFTEKKKATSGPWSPPDSRPPQACLEAGSRRHPGRCVRTKSLQGELKSSSCAGSSSTVQRGLLSHVLNLPLSAHDVPHSTKPFHAQPDVRSKSN